MRVDASCGQRHLHSVCSSWSGRPAPKSLQSHLPRAGDRKSREQVSSCQTFCEPERGGTAQGHEGGGLQAVSWGQKRAALCGLWVFGIYVEGMRRCQNGDHRAKPGEQGGPRGRNERGVQISTCLPQSSRPKAGPGLPTSCYLICDRATGSELQPQFTCSQHAVQWSSVYPELRSNLMRTHSTTSERNPGLGHRSPSPGGQPCALHLGVCLC